MAISQLDQLQLQAQLSDPGKLHQQCSCEQSLALQRNIRQQMHRQHWRSIPRCMLASYINLSNVLRHQLAAAISRYRQAFRPLTLTLRPSFWSQRCFSGRARATASRLVIGVSQSAAATSHASFKVEGLLVSSASQSARSHLFTAVHLPVKGLFAVASDSEHFQKANLHLSCVP